MRRPSILLLAVLLGILAAMAAKSVLIELPPVRSHNGIGQFDTERAAGRLAFLLGDQKPHPADTPEDDAVRSRLIGILSGMGLKPIVRDQMACNELYKARGVACARVRNVIVILGPASGKALLLNAHYDSTPVGPAAADDGSGVATLLEVASIIKDRPLKRPVILLFNEGEELGLIGARAFLADPLSQNVDSLVNLEARGVRGPVNMFETSRPNDAPIALFSASVKHPVANSLSTDVYRLLPNYTDVNSFSERGWLTLNLAPIGNETRYHSPGDDIAALDHRTLQHMGDQTLALAEALANGTPTAGTGNSIFMDLSGQGLISLPLTVGFALLLGLLIVFAAFAWRRGKLITGLLVAAGALIGSAAVSWIALEVIGLLRGGMFWRAHPVWTNLATYAAVLFAGVALIATIGGRADRTQLRAAFWLVFLLVGGAIGIAAPGGIVFFLFPPLIVLIGMLAGRLWQPAERAATWVAVLLLYLTWGAMLALLEELLNGGPMWIFGPLGALLIIPVLIEAKPLIQRAGLTVSLAVGAGIALLFWAVAGVAPAYSADRQQRFTIEHITNLRRGETHWSVLNDGKALPFDYRKDHDWHRGKLSHSDKERWLTSAPLVPGLQSPTIEIVGSTQNQSARTVTVRLHSNGAESILLLAPKRSDIRYAGFEGFMRPIDPSASDRQYMLHCFGRSCDGATLRFVTASLQPIDFTLVGSRRGLPQAAAPFIAARPQNARPQYTPDETVTLSRVWL